MGFRKKSRRGEKLGSQYLGTELPVTYFVLFFWRSPSWLFEPQLVLLMVSDAH